jgi:hypothetical protein
MKTIERGSRDDPELVDRLWHLSERLTGVAFARMV